jgi:predicted nucleic acid-binding protein
VTEAAPSEGAVLLDTDAFSYLHRSAPEAQELWPKVEGRLPLLSFVSVGELLSGALQRGWGEQKRIRLQARIDSMTVIPFDEIVISAYAETTAWAVAHGHPLGVAVHSNDA